MGLQTIGAYIGPRTIEAFFVSSSITSFSYTNNYANNLNRCLHIISPFCVKEDSRLILTTNIKTRLDLWINAFLHQNNIAAFYRFCLLNTCSERFMLVYSWSRCCPNDVHILILIKKWVFSYSKYNVDGISLCGWISSLRKCLRC